MHRRGELSLCARLVMDALSKRLGGQSREVVQAAGYAAETMTRNMLARDAAEGIDAFLEKRAPKWSGC
jgi:enoyl-CoA hydratase/carnithine racemase